MPLSPRSESGSNTGDKRTSTHSEDRKESKRQRSESGSNVGAQRDVAKIGESLIQMGDIYRDNGEFKRAAKSYNLAKMFSPSEAQERLNRLPPSSLSPENDIFKGNHCKLIKEKAIKVIKRHSSHKSSLMGPFFPEGTHPTLPPLMSQGSLTSQGAVCTFNEAQDINSIVTSYIGADAETKLVLHGQINKIIKQFDTSFICLETVQELVILAKIPEKAVFLHVITQMLKALKEKPLLASTVLQGMAVALNSCPEEINMDGMQGTYLDILRPLKGYLETVRIKQNEHQLIPLLNALSALFNVMVCKEVSALDRLTIFNPLIELFDKMKSHDDTTVVFLALYAKQALTHISNSESLAMSVFRRARLAIVMVGYIVNGVTSTDLSKFETAYNYFTAMCDVAKEAEWYPGLTYVDCILELHNWSEFEAFVLQSKFKSDKCFLQGICLRLEQIAAIQQHEIRNGAIRFLQGLAGNSEEIVQKTAQAALRRLGVNGSTALDLKDATQHLSKMSSDNSVIQAYRDGLPPVWDPIWHKATRSDLLKATQRKERLNMNIDNMAKDTPTIARLGDVHEALQSYYKPSLFIQRVSGGRLDLESCYINLAVVEAPGQRKKDKKHLEKQSATFQ
ncbi:hypothetical protein BGX27_001413, partial [Mortierella sp. AM989]